MHFCLEKPQWAFQHLTINLRHQTEGATTTPHSRARGRALPGSRTLRQQNFFRQALRMAPLPRHRER